VAASKFVEVKNGEIISLDELVAAALIAVSLRNRRFKYGS